MSFRLPTFVGSRKIQGLPEIRDTKYPVDLTIRNHASLLDGMKEIEERFGRYSEAETLALLESLERFEPTEEEIEQMYKNADLEGMEVLSYK